MSDRPSFIRIGVTSRCNLNCNTCYASKDRDELPTQNIFEIINKIKEFGVSRIIFSGGEPFLRGDLEEIVSYTSKNGISCDIVSNGTLIDEAYVRFIKSYVSDLCISFDGYNEDINDVLRDHSSKKVIATLNLLKTSKTRFNLISVISKMNIDYIDRIIDFGKRAGAEEHHFVRFVPVGVN